VFDLYGGYPQLKTHFQWRFSIQLTRMEESHRSTNIKQVSTTTSQYSNCIMHPYKKKKDHRHFKYSQLLLLSYNVLVKKVLITDISNIPSCILSTTLLSFFNKNLKFFLQCHKRTSQSSKSRHWSNKLIIGTKSNNFWIFKYRVQTKNITGLKPKNLIIAGTKITFKPSSNL
jgi:hypothetical protein